MGYSLPWGRIPKTRGVPGASSHTSFHLSLTSTGTFSLLSALDSLGNHSHGSSVPRRMRDKYNVNIILDVIEVPRDQSFPDII